MLKVIMEVVNLFSAATPLAGHAAATCPGPASIRSAPLRSGSPLPKARRPGAKGGQVQGVRRYQHGANLDLQEPAGQCDEGQEDFRVAPPPQPVCVRVGL